MKNLYHLFSVIITVSIFFSCQKEFKEPIIPAPIDLLGKQRKIQTYTEDISVSGIHTITSLKLNYDANDRLISMISSASGGDKYIFEYKSATMYTLDFYKAGVLNLHEDVFLTSFSLVDTTVLFNSSNKIFLTEKYLYNSAKQLIKLKKYDYSTPTSPVLTETFNYEYDTNGNVKRVTASKYNITYDYYTNITAKVTGIALPHMPVTTTNFIKTTTMSAGGLSQVFSHSYTFDSNNRLSTEKTAFPGSNDSVLKTYTYY